MTELEGKIVAMKRTSDWAFCADGSLMRYVYSDNGTELVQTIPPPPVYDMARFMPRTLNFSDPGPDLSGIEPCPDEAPDPASDPD